MLKLAERTIGTLLYAISERNYIARTKRVQTHVKICGALPSHLQRLVGCLLHALLKRQHINFAKQEGYHSARPGEQTRMNQVVMGWLGGRLTTFQAAQMLAPVLLKQTKPFFFYRCVC